MPEENESITIFKCGPKEKCSDGTEHDYSGWEEFDGGGTAVCCRCGHRAIDNACWH